MFQESWKILKTYWLKLEQAILLNNQMKRLKIIAQENTVCFLEMPKKFKKLFRLKKYKCKKFKDNSNKE